MRHGRRVEIEHLVFCGKFSVLFQFTNITTLENLALLVVVEKFLN